MDGGRDRTGRWAAGTIGDRDMINSIELSGRIEYRGDKKAYVAHVTGRHPKFAFARDFVPARKSTSRSGRTGTVTATVIDTGLYEEGDSDGARRYHVVLRSSDGDLVVCEIKEATALEIAQALDDGREIDELVPVPSATRPGMWAIRVEGSLNWRRDANARDEAIAEIRRLMVEHAITAKDLDT
jgi:hypothetical protein